MTGDFVIKDTVPKLAAATILFWAVFITIFALYQKKSDEYQQFESYSMAKMCYESNKEDINSIWSGRKVAIKGTVNFVDLDEANKKCYIILSGNEYPHIICEMLVYRVGVREGDIVTICGIFKRVNGWVEIEKCFLY
jgi:hypothetical protein